MTGQVTICEVRLDIIAAPSKQAFGELFRGCQKSCSSAWSPEPGPGSLVGLPACLVCVLDVRHGDTISVPLQSDFYPVLHPSVSTNDHGLEFPRSPVPSSTRGPGEVMWVTVMLGTLGSSEIATWASSASRLCRSSSLLASSWTLF